MCFPDTTYFFAGNVQSNLYNETEEILPKAHKFHNLPDMVFTKSCLLSLSWETTCIERPQNLVLYTGFTV